MMDFQILLNRILALYKKYPNKGSFFYSSLNYHMGVIENLVRSELFRKQTINRVSERVIRNSWEPELE